MNAMLLNILSEKPILPTLVFSPQHGRWSRTEQGHGDEQVQQLSAHRSSPTTIDRDDEGRIISTRYLDIWRWIEIPESLSALPECTFSVALDILGCFLSTSMSTACALVFGAVWL